MKLAEIHSLCKQYPSFALRDVSFSLEEGRICGFIGRNGAGKTTAIKSMLNLVHPDSGEIVFFGKDFSEHEDEIKPLIGYSTGAVSYFPHKKIRRLVEVTRSFFPNWDEEAYRRCRALFDIDEEKTPAELSEGMRVKLNLLLALSHRARLLILDEPTSNLDPFSRDELLDLFLLLKEQGTAVFYSTHIISDLEKCADDIVYIREGRIVFAGTQASFREEQGLPGETLEETMLRLEREARHA